MIWSNKGKEYDAIAQNICAKDAKYYIWGAGTFGQSFYDMFQEKINIIGFIDSDVNKQGIIKLKRNKMLNVYSPDFFEYDQDAKIIVGTGWISEVYAKLNSKGFELGTDYFHANDFMAVYMLYRENKVHVISANIILTTRCTLKCEKCMALMPYVKNPKHYSFEEIQNELDTYFQWVDYLGVLGLGGGDVLLHPQFDEILEWVCNKYVGSKIQDVEIYTNAIIMPKRRILDLCKKYDVIVRFSDYSKQPDVKQNIEQFVQLLEGEGIRYDRCVWDTWYDIGFPQETNGLIGEKSLMEHYDKCITKLCSIICNKKLYFCSVHASAVVAGYCEENENDYFELDNYTPTRRKEFIEFNTGYCSRGYLTYCQKCNGYQNINGKFVPVAKQLGRKT